MNAATTPEADKLPVSTTISDVTVYTDQAQVTRQAKITLTGEERSLLLTDLPLTIQPESFRVRGTGTVAVRLLGVKTETVHTTEPVAERVAQLEQQIEALNDQLRQLKERLKSLNLQRDFVMKLGEKSVDRFSRGLAEQRVDLNQTNELMEFVGRRYSELSDAIAQHEQQERELNKQLTAVLHQKSDLEYSDRDKSSYSLTIGILPSGTGEFDLEVLYTVDRASWQPLYDLRVDTHRGVLQLDYLAQVTQSTGEDWTDVALTLSTAKPGLGTLPPKLNPWYIDVPAPPPPPVMAAPMMQRKAIISAGASRDADFLDEYDEHDDLDNLSTFDLSENAAGFAAPKTYEAESVQSQVSSEGGVVTFQIDGNANIPGDRTPHKITIFKNEYPGKLEYIAIPKLVSYAYLQAVVTNPNTGATLLPGQATIFRDDTFIGTTELENVAPGQEFKLNLGIDEGLKLERDLIDRKVDKRFINDKRVITYGYRLVVTNLRDRDTTLNLTEQLPVSRNEQIKVRLTRSTPQIQPGKMGKLEWTIALRPQATQEIFYQFTIEHPRDLQVAGLEE